MASGQTPIYELPYPVASDPVDVHGDVQDLAEKIEFVLSNAGTPYVSIEVFNNSGSTINKGDPVYISGYNSGSSKPEITKANADDTTIHPVIGLASGTYNNGQSGTVIISGVFSNINTSAFSSADILYVASGGGLTNVQPAVGSGAVALVLEASGVGSILVTRLKGNATWGSLKAGLS